MFSAFMAPRAFILLALMIPSLYFPLCQHEIDIIGLYLVSCWMDGLTIWHRCLCPPQDCDDINDSMIFITSVYLILPPIWFMTK